MITETQWWCLLGLLAAWVVTQAPTAYRSCKGIVRAPHWIALTRNAGGLTSGAPEQVRIDITTVMAYRQNMPGDVPNKGTRLFLSGFNIDVNEEFDVIDALFEPPLIAPPPAPPTKPTVLGIRPREVPRGVSY